ncbi:aldolase [Pseudomonas luteola]|uniref:3-oxo-tetronate 4-phosphate decarboxylase n=1 Tax=Pseudomonas luteola TaxID=47886 RepID=UPI000F78B3A7|nr:aldolase [Pseudomonas luteola]RRW39909.1 aldolase [Pseudomonas luteola]
MPHTEQEIREEICKVGRSLYQRGYTVGTAGNISARLDDGWLITPTDACLGYLSPEAIAKVDVSGAWISGEKPSKTLSLHRQVYDRNPDVRGVVHTHSTHLVALTLKGCWSHEAILPPLTPYQVMKVGHIPLISYDRPGAAAVAEQVGVLANTVRGVMLERLGPVIWETSVSKASFALEELEETARLWLMTEPKPVPLDEAALDLLEEAFGVKW